jgi:endonuclease/exonuclease/phosphatase family metal-dependent hydrolase
MTGHSGIVVAALTWNLFHGRDHPRKGGPDARRSLLAEFAAVLDGLPWEVALLQEAPPRWLDDLGRACRANGALGLTSRNELPGLRSAIADRFPDLIKSGEGGSNMTLVRAPARIEVVERHRLALRPERRALLLTRLATPAGARLSVANMHLSVPATGRGQAEVLRAAELAVAFAGDDPLILGGDLNLRPSQHAAAFEELERRYGLAAPTGPKAIDHLLVRGLTVVEPPHAAERTAGPLRLSDHAPVVASFGMR